MKKQISILTALAVAVFMLSSCASVAAENQTQAQEQNKNAQTTNTDTTIVQSTAVTNAEILYNFDGLTEYLSDSPTIVTDENAVITESGSYEFSGAYSTITVNVDKTLDEGVVYLVFNNAKINSENDTPINIIEAKDVVIVLEDSTENSVYQGQIDTSDEEFPSASIYSKADTAITGGGSLTVETLYNDGINSRDDLVIVGANINVAAASDGIVGKDLLAIDSSSITVSAGKDGLKSSNTEDAEKGNIIITSGEFNITAQNDAISSDNILQIDGGEFTLASGGGYTGVIKTPSSGGMGGGLGGEMPDFSGEANADMSGEARGELGDFSAEMGEDFGGGRSGFDPSTNTFDDEDDDVSLEESMKALKAVNNIIINGGTFDISSYEDAVHSDGDVNINGGDFTINTGDDGIHANSTVFVTNGTINIENCFEGIEGVFVSIYGGDIDINTDDDAINGSDRAGGVTITGGNINIVFGQGGDGIDSNGFYTQSGGDIVITALNGSDAMNAPLDVDGTVTLSGGTIVDENGQEVEASSHGSMGGGMRGGMGEMNGEMQMPNGMNEGRDMPENMPQQGNMQEDTI